ncbi:MAG: hypothetical protein NC548_31235 [Lachnospiraceae bacterium]|nr:hypothetical protein [Bacteroides fragilis]MCM1218978.1 hypothetical protein [Lachnospiraceae bacterium]
MKIKSEYISASRAIRQIANKYGANPVYVWDVADEQFNIIKGLGCFMNQEEIDTISEIVEAGLK